MRPGGRFLFIEHTLAPKVGSLWYSLHGSGARLGGTAGTPQPTSLSPPLLLCPSLTPQAQPLRRLQQRLLNPLQRLLADGCHLNRDPLPAIEDAFLGLDATRLEVEGMGLIAPHVAGIASL